MAGRRPAILRLRAETTPTARETERRTGRFPAFDLSAAFPQNRGGRPMPKTMKAAVVREFGKPLTIEEVAVPEPGPGQVQVKIEASGVCHTDLHAAEGDWPVKPNPPFIPGHEGVGYVSAVGAGVKLVKEGDRVGIPWLYSSCGHCKHCLGGWETLCHEQENTGYSVNGGFAEYAIADPNYVGHLPANVSFNDIAPILCAGVTVYKGLKMTETKPGDWVVISGIGGLGHVAVQYAKAMGMNVAAVDVDDAKLDLARRLGATVTVNAKTSNDPAAEIKAQTDGGAQGVLVTAVSPKAFEQAVNMTARGATVALNGLPPGDFPLSIFDMVLNGTTVRGSIVGTRLDLQEALQFAADEKVRATVSVEPLENINDIFQRMHKGQIEGRIVMNIN
jgi:propanol-preferring alcohol dehydrogenase